MAIQKGVKKANEKHKKFVINFGKYKGLKITEMISEDQLKYCHWFIAERKKSHASHSQRKRDMPYKAFYWWTLEYNRIAREA